MQSNNTPQPGSRLPYNGDLKSFCDVFYRLMHKRTPNKKRVLDASLIYQPQHRTHLPQHFQNRQPPQIRQRNLTARPSLQTTPPNKSKIFSNVCLFSVHSRLPIFRLKSQNSRLFLSQIITTFVTTLK